MLAIPLSAIGYWQVCQTLKLSGIKRTTWMFWLIAYGAALGAVGHAGFAACIVLLQQGASLAQTFDYLQSYVAVPFGVFLLCYLSMSAWYCIIVLSRPTLYPRWMALINPFLLSVVIELLNVSHVLPVLGNVLSPAWLSIPHLLFFTLSTLVLWIPKGRTCAGDLARETEPVREYSSAHNPRVCGFWRLSKKAARYKKEKYNPDESPEQKEEISCQQNKTRLSPAAGSRRSLTGRT